MLLDNRVPPMTPMDTCMEDNQKAECTARSARVASFVYTTAEMLRSSQPCSIHTYISIRKDLKLLTYIHTYGRTVMSIDLTWEMLSTLTEAPPRAEKKSPDTPGILLILSLVVHIRLES